MKCPITQHDCQTTDCLERGCAMQRGAGYSQLQQASPTDIEQAQADSLEAHSLKYHHCAQVFQLESGKYALFGSFAPGEGIPLITIGTWAELEPHVREYRKRADEHAARPRPLRVEAKAKPSMAYDELDFGDET